MRNIRTFVIFWIANLQSTFCDDVIKQYKPSVASVFDFIPVIARSFKELVIMFWNRGKRLIPTQIKSQVYFGNGDMIGVCQKTEDNPKSNNQNPYAIFGLLKALTKAGFFKIPANFWEEHTIKTEYSNPESGLAILMSQIFASMNLQMAQKFYFVGDVDLQGNLVKTNTPRDSFNFAFEQNCDLIFAPKELSTLIPKGMEDKVKLCNSIYEVLEDSAFQDKVIANPEARHKTYNCLCAYTNSRGKLHFCLIQGIITPGKGKKIMVQNSSKQEVLDEILQNSVTRVIKGYENSSDLEKLNSHDIYIKMSDNNSKFYIKHFLHKAIELLLHAIILDREINPRHIVQLNHYLSKENREEILRLGIKSIIEPKTDVNGILEAGILLPAKQLSSTEQSK